MPPRIWGTNIFPNALFEILQTGLALMVIY